MFEVEPLYITIREIVGMSEVGMWATAKSDLQTPIYIINPESQPSALVAGNPLTPAIRVYNTHEILHFFSLGIASNITKDKVESTTFEY